MPVDLGAHVVIVDDGRVLLIKREDAEMWSLPAGAVEEGETIAQAAVREAREETGLDVELTRLVGVYSQPRHSNHSVVFLARVVGGEMRPQPGEAIDVRFFDPADLPTPLVWWVRQRIEDALNGVGGSAAWLQDVFWSGPPFESRRDLYALRDQSGLSRPEFFERHLGRVGPLGEMREL